MSKSIINVVLDLETLSTQENAAIIQIGCAVPFFDWRNVPSNTAPEFEVTIAYEEAIGAAVFHKSRDTMEWWEKQDPEIRKQVFSGQDSYCTALDSLNGWLNDLRYLGSDIVVYGNGSDFDNKILSYTISALNYPNMWNFRNNRDMRTMRHLFPLSEIGSPKQDLRTKHTAVGDATYEAELLHAMWVKYPYLRGVL